MRRALLALTVLAALVVATGTEPAGATTTDVDTEAEYRTALTTLSGDTSGPHTIEITADFTISDPGMAGAPTYSGDQALTIDGNGHTVDSTGSSRFLQQLTDTPLTIDSLTVTGFNSNAAAVDAAGEVAILSSTFHNNISTSSTGAVIGRVTTITSSTFTSNQGSFYGAVNAGSGATVVTDSTFRANEATTGGTGALGAFDVEIHGGVFEDNEAGQNGGAVLANEVDVDGTAFRRNAASGGVGGAIMATTSVTVDNAEFEDNTAYSGGAVYISDGPAEITGSDFQANTSVQEGGAVSGDSTVSVGSSRFSDNRTGVGGSTQFSDGGAIWARGTVTATDAEFTGNDAGDDTTFHDGGAIFSQVAVTLVDSTLWANTAGHTGGGAAGSTVTATNSTITDNRSGQGGAGLEGNLTLRYATVVGNYATNGSVANLSGPLTAFGSVVADPVGGGPNCSGSTVSQGFNWSDDDSCGFTGTGDTEDDGADPLLGPPRNNGSPPTRYPLNGSPLVNAIPPICHSSITVDQRGVGRPFDGACDIGAVERVYPAHGFSDVPTWAAEGVRWITSTVNDPPLMTGYSDGTFRPDANITRGQVARMLYRLAGSPDVSALPPHGFSDVPAWVTDAVRWAAANTIVTGYPDGTFRPDLPISRAQVTRMNHRLAGSPDTSGLPPHGLSDVPAWVEDAVRWAVADRDGTGPAASLMTGYSDGTFRPDANITRGQVARKDYRLAITPAAWLNPSVAPHTLPFRPDTP